MGKKPVVSLRVYKGKQMSYDENGNVQNENQKVTLTHDTIQWKNFMTNLRMNGYIKVEVEKAQIIDSVKQEDGHFKDKVSDYDGIDEIKSEVKDYFEPKPIEKTPQEEIAELKKQLQEFMSGKKPKEEKRESKKESTDNLDALREEYIEVVGKKPHHMLGEEKLRKAIEKAK